MKIILSSCSCSSSIITVIMKIEANRQFVQLAIKIILRARQKSYTYLKVRRLQEELQIVITRWVAFAKAEVGAYRTAVVSLKTSKTLNTVS